MCLLYNRIYIHAVITKQETSICSQILLLMCISIIYVRLYTYVKMYICLDSFVLSLCIVYVRKIVTKATLNGEHTRKTITAITNIKHYSPILLVHCIHSTHLNLNHGARNKQSNTFFYHWESF